jgi:hypothetical protein
MNPSTSDRPRANRVHGTPHQHAKRAQPDSESDFSSTGQTPTNTATESKFPRAAAHIARSMLPN